MSALETLRNARAILTWSGGLDTTTLVAVMIEHYNVTAFPIFINRGQENYAEESKAITYFTSLFSERYPSSFCKPLEVNAVIPPLEFKENFPEAEIAKTHALRNSDIVNNAVRYALILNISHIVVGSNIDDNAFGDNSVAYWRTKTMEIREGTDNKNLQVVAPFQELGWNKKDMVLWCHNYGIPVHKSWSCWKAHSKHCGVCSPCKRRKEAFKLAEVEDLTGYLE